MKYLGVARKEAKNSEQHTTERNLHELSNKQYNNSAENHIA